MQQVWQQPQQQAKPQPRQKMRLGELLVEEQILTAAQITDALVVQKKRRPPKPLGIVCQELGYFSANDLTQLLLTHGRRADAEQVARAALRANPHNAQAHNLFGMLLSELNDLPSGEWHFRRALELAGPKAPFLMNLALNLMKQGRAEAADGYFAQANELAPGDMKTLAYWSNLHEARGDLPRAQELLDRAQAVSSAGEVNLLRASYLSRAGRLEEALAIRTKALPANNFFTVETIGNDRVQTEDGHGRSKTNLRTTLADRRVPPRLD